MPQISALAQSVNASFNVSNLSLLVVTGRKSHVNNDVGRVVEVCRFGVHLVKFPIFGCGDGDNCADRGEVTVQRGQRRPGS